MPIVTDGLIGYWNSKQGINGSIWENLSPSYKGSHNGAINGAAVQVDGMYFDGVDDKITFNQAINLGANFSFDFWIKPQLPSASAGAILSYSISTPASMLAYNSQKIAWSFNAYKTTNSIPPNVLYHVVVAFSYEDGTVKYYVNGTLDSTHSQRNNWGSTGWAIGSMGSSFFKGHIPSLRLYNKTLTPEEVSNNYSVGTEVGLDSQPIQQAPLVTTTRTDKGKISDEPNINQSIITVQFDKNVTEYVARLNGTDHLTGVIVHQGGAVSANTNAQVIIDWNELSSEGANRINIYGKGLDGQWTPHEFESTLKYRYIRDWTSGESGTRNMYRWREIQAFDKSGVNVALGKPTTFSKMTDLWDQGQLNDGIAAEGNGAVLFDSVTPGKAHYAEIDLGSLYELKEVKIWHEVRTSTYAGTKTEVSRDGVVWTALFDSATDGVYAESPDGKTHVIM